MKQDVRLCRDIFKRHSTTYYYSTWIFPRAMRHKVYVLYAFVRLADEYVDNPAEGSDPKERLEQFRDQFNAAWKGLRVTSPLSQEENKVIHTFVALAKNESFEKPWIDGFFTSMEWDIWRTTYETDQDIAAYIFGSADVIGLMMARIMGTAQNALPSAQLLGTAFQRINFLRDIEEDRERGRIYLPLSLLKEHGISEKEWLQKKPRDERYKKLVVAEAAAIRAMWPTIWAGLRTLSPRCRLAVGLSCKGYFATLGKIEEEPLLPFQKPLRMRKLWLFRLLLTTLSRITRAHVPK